jgi:hypothetical protein
MRGANQPDRQAQRQTRLFFIGIGVTVLMLLLIFALALRMTGSGESNASSATVTMGNPGSSAAPSTTIGARDEVVNRLHEIFRVRDQAIQTRDSRVLNDIYTVDCPCLKGDQALIKRLRDERLVWDGVKVTLIVEDAEQVNDRLWIVNAVVETSAFEIKRESGTTVRGVPSGQERSRFALARPSGQKTWLLGQASIIDERD